ncbi:MAG: hypothetical protein HOP30_11055 [Cyclobacteriaceae bacterium]|nr:hypothetical protein [Cyclobacteriaceae bacterium]
MPPFYDIYGLSKRRDKQTIETFLDFYCHRELIENYQGQDVEIAIYKNDKYGVNEEFVPVDNLSEVINYGLSHPDCGFAFYVGAKSNYKKDIGSLILKFTFDGKMIFGVSIEEKRLIDGDKLIDNYDAALEIEKTIVELTNSIKTSIQLEYAPSDDEEEFDRDIEMWRKMNEEKRKIIGK